MELKTEKYVIFDGIRCSNIEHVKDRGVIEAIKYFEVREHGFK